MNKITIDNITLAELRNEIRLILREELAASREERDIWVSGEKDAAQFLGISVGTISSMVQSGKLEGCYARIGLKKLNFNISKIRAIMQ